MVYLMYHDIVTDDDKRSGFQNENAFMYKVGESSFESQVRAVKNMEVCFTFDDGGDSFYYKAAPILEKYGKRGLFFISTKYIGSQGFLTVDQIKELSLKGHVIGSHSHSHPSNISSFGAGKIFDEWKKSIEVLSRIVGKKITVASIPNGYASKKVIEQASRAGIKNIYTSTPTTHTSQQYNVVIKGRYVIHSSTGTGDVLSIVNSRMMRFGMSMRWGILEIVKMTLGENYDKMKSLLHGNNQ